MFLSLNIRIAKRHACSLGWFGEIIHIEPYKDLIHFVFSLSLYC